jgi:hypothetical protein
MVTKHFFSILLGCLTALCITSCLGSDDDANNSSKGLSKAEIAQCYLTVGGNYSGDLLYFSKSDDGLFEEVDTLDGAWYIPTDSTLFITDFPSEVLAENVIYSELKDALADAPDQIVKCRIRFVETSPVQFLVNPYTLEYMLHYGGGDHKVQVVFYNENIYSFGVLNAESRELMLKIIPAYLYVDGKQTNYLTQSQIIFVSRKQ